MSYRAFPVFLVFSAFSAAQTLTLDLTAVPVSVTPQSLITGDFNHDGKPDLAVTGSQGSVVILLGNGDGTFRNGQTIPVTAPATRIVKADFNQDGNLDLAVMVGSNGQVVVLLGNADGTFQAPVDSGAKTPSGVFTPGNNPTLMAGDINGDGKVDLILGPYSMASASISLASSSTMSVLPGNGDGTFQAPVVSSIAPISYATATPVDFYNNGRIDVFLAGTHATYPNSSLLTGAADGTLTEKLFAALSNDVDAFYALTAGAVNANGPPAAVVVDTCTPSGIFVFLNGSFTPAVSTQPDICVDQPHVPGYTQVAIADMNGDGIPDLLVNEGSGYLYVIPGQGNGAFAGTAGTFYTGAAPSISPGADSGFDIYGSIAAADFRGTGKQDVVIALAGKGVVLLRNDSGTPPSVTSGGVMSSASLTAIPAVAGSLTSIFGSGLAYATGIGYNPNILPNWLFGTAVTLNGSPVPLMWLSPTQANVQIPWEEAGLSQATLVVTRNEMASQSITIQLAPAAPALFSMNGQGTGQAAALIAGSSTIAAPVGAFSSSRPALPGEYVAFYGTGLGAVVEPLPLITGEATPTTDGPFQPFTDIYYSTVQKATVTVGGVAATVQFSGLAPALIGVYQINVQVPANAPSGAAVPVVLSIGGATANAVTVAIGPS
jgi:uncharacterized protein (TIGR03437 family)